MLGIDKEKTMAIWKTPFTLEHMQARRSDTLVEHLNIEFVEIGDDYLVAKMPVDKTTVQPLGVLHGGASCALAETVGSIAANFCVDLEKQYCVGSHIQTHHLRVARPGWVYGTARPVHIGKTTQVWEIKILNEQKHLISLSTLTMAVINRT